MADGTADFTMRLHNQVSGPAKAMRNSIRNLGSDLGFAQKVFAQGENEFHKKLKERRKAFDDMQRRQRRTRDATTERNRLTQQRLAQRRSIGFQRQQVRQQEAERRARQQARREEGLEPGMGIGSKAGLFAVVGALAAGAAAAGFLAAKITSATVAAIDFGQRSKTALTSILKDGALAGQQFNQVRNEAQRLGLDVTDTVDEFKMLANSGFKVPMARELVRMSADLQALTGSSESASFALRAISQIKMKGRLQAEEITGQLAEHGVSADEVYKVLGKTLGKTREEILKMQKAGDLSADVAIPAILQAVRNQLGVEQSGGFALKMNAGSVGGMFRTLKAQVQNAFISLGERVGPGITRAFQSIMAQIQAAVASPKMQAFGNAVVQLFDTISSMVGRTDFATLLTEAASMLGREIVAAATFIRDHGAELRESFVTFVRFMMEGIRAAIDFMKPVMKFLNSRPVQFLMESPEQNVRSVDELFDKNGKLRTPEQRASAAESARRVGAAAGGNSFGDIKFGDINVTLSGTDATPDGTGAGIEASVRKQMLAMLQDI